MQPDITWTEVAVRLLLTLVAGAIIGTNRGEHRSPAGLRTTILVCLTASASMILGNLLIGTSRRAPNSFVTMDVMRLPLNFNRHGFIGAGAILHQGSMVLGVTTAATLWFTTLMGFCFGAGEHGLGMSLLGLGVFVLWCLEWLKSAGSDLSRPLSSS
jgi:putative Mg2+ transporter-C (MgtC) family protein